MGACTHSHMGRTTPTGVSDGHIVSNPSPHSLPNRPQPATERPHQNTSPTPPHPMFSSVPCTWQRSKNTCKAAHSHLPGLMQLHWRRHWQGLQRGLGQGPASSRMQGSAEAARRHRFPPLQTGARHAAPMATTHTKRAQVARVNGGWVHNGGHITLTMTLARPPVHT